MGDGEGGGFHNRKEKKRKDRVEYYSLLMMRSVFERETKYTVAGKLMTTAPPNFLPPSHPLFFSPPLLPSPQESASVPASSPVCCRR